MIKKRQTWGNEENEMLIKIMNEANSAKMDCSLKWERVSIEMVKNGFQKTAKQCRERWIQKLNPEASREKWTFDENRQLFALYRAKQNHWKEISKDLVARTDNAAKNQFFALIRKGLRKACRSIGLTNNTAKINMIKPKVLLDFFESTYNVESTSFSKTIVISEFIEYYALTDRPPCGIYDAHKREIINQLMSHLARNNENYEKIKNGEIANFDESNKFFKRTTKSRLIEHMRSPPMSLVDQSYVLGAKSFDDSFCPNKPAYNENHCFVRPHLNIEKEHEHGEDRINDISLLNDDQTIKFSPEYKPEENYAHEMNFSTDKFELRENENMDATFNSKHLKPSNLESPKSLFRFLSDGLKSKTAVKPLSGRLGDGGELSPDLMVRPGTGWDQGSDDFKKNGFCLNLINIDENILVPEIVNSRSRESFIKFDLTNSLASDKSKKESM